MDPKEKEQQLIDSFIEGQIDDWIEAKRGIGEQIDSEFADYDLLAAQAYYSRNKGD